LTQIKGQTKEIKGSFAWLKLQNIGIIASCLTAIQNVLFISFLVK